MPSMEVQGRARRRRAVHRALRRRRVGLSTGPSVRVVRVARAATSLSDTEQKRRLDRLAKYLVRTIRACPAPGIAPFTARDWLLIGAAGFLPYLIVFWLASLPSRP